MSKKYKLKKWYPSLHTQMTVGYEVSVIGPCGYYNPRFSFPSVRIDEVENFPEFWEKIESPLFITEDKVEIFNGDNYWFVVKSDLEIVKAWIPRLHICDWDYSGEYKKPPLGHVQFSAEKAAKDWVDLNEPKYSLNKIRNTFERIGWTNEMFIIFRDIIK